MPRHAENGQEEKGKREQSPEPTPNPPRETDEIVNDAWNMRRMSSAWRAIIDVFDQIKHRTRPSRLVRHGKERCTWKGTPARRVGGLTGPGGDQRHQLLADAMMDSILVVIGRRSPPLIGNDAFQRRTGASPAR